MTYIELPITTDEQALQDDALAFIQGKVDGYTLDPAHPMTWLIEAFGRMLAVALFQASLMPSENMRTLGETVYEIPRGDGTEAVASTTWTAIDTLGHDIPAGTAILIDGVPFVVDVPATIPPGSASTSAGEVSVTALDVGVGANGLGSDASPVDALAWLDTIDVVGSTAGGADAESDEDYQDRLTRFLRLQGPRAITARDFETFTLQTIDGPRAGVARVTSIDLLDATGPTPNSPGHITVVPIDANGAACTSGVKADILADLQAARTLNLVVHVVDPTTTNITIAYSVVAYSGFDLTALQSSIDGALASYFDPSSWGQPPFGETARWVNDSKVRYLQVARVIENVEGVDHIVSLTVNAGTSDVTMTGIGPLPALQPITTHTVA